MLVRGLVRGAAAGAAGTTALNAITYLDMALRARPASDTPQQAVDELARRTGHRVPGADEHRQNRLAGLGPLSGIATGLAVGAVGGLLRNLGVRLPAVLGSALLGGAAMIASDLPLAKLGVSHPSQWSARSWLADAIPHLAYGMTTHGVLAALDGGRLV
jgi:hypothetical protein